ncbi:VOC family protein [Amorphus orientalis]|uniref:VOC family protein n=1 Tax=Amorphus orientalis TaxID=649198 RepID=UPI0027D88510|nr:VOC family protein [Amorphus orientalis]
MIDHIGFAVGDYEKAKAFYTAALAPLGIAAVMEVGPEQTAHGGHAIGFGRGFKPEFWIATGGPSPQMHIALLAEDRAQVDAFYRAALEAGATDNGAPGLRPQYHPDYYGAFVIDPEGHNLEAVCHGPA